ncbi:MAG: NAD(P)-dependent alcohol dehydrogenase, partial [Chloroflexota bacterium]
YYLTTTGTCAEYILVQANQLSRLPDTVSWIDAASVPLVSLTALQALRDNAKIQSGMRVCINGASGGVGSMAVQIAKICGCRVTAIASESNHDFLSDLGADICLDYRQNDIRNSDQHFDIFFDVFGNTHFRDIKPILSKNGTWVSTVIKQHVFTSIALSKLSSKSAELVVVKAVSEDLSQIAEWMVDGRLRAIIHQTYPIEQIAQAHQQQQSKHTRGKLVITI